MRSGWRASSRAGAKVQRGGTESDEEEDDDDDEDEGNERGRVEERKEGAYREREIRKFPRRGKT